MLTVDMAERERHPLCPQERPEHTYRLHVRFNRAGALILGQEAAPEGLREEVVVGRDRGGQDDGTGAGHRFFPPGAAPN